MASDDKRSEDQPLSTETARPRVVSEGAMDTEGDDDAELSSDSGGLGWSSGPVGGLESTSRPEGRRGLAAELEAALADDSGRGLETRRQKAMIAAALFDEPVMPIKIGRFTIVRELGAGGMGVVYVAYDEQLDRRLAVKLLRGASPSSDASRRLEREAQAMARLSHPNVVIVHDSGIFEGQVFVAMEFVEGQDLRGWLKSEPRTWRAIIDVFRQAGEGLAAAHDGGIVHRDFKPDNVLVGNDGRVRVADFGLAHAFDAPAEPRDSELTNSQSSSSRLSVSLTRTGAIMGTPAYMPSEQFAGLRTDARSDQFSFCVALWEGLYGRRPFAGHNIAALSLSISEGRIEPPPADNGVPTWIAAILTRGLSSKPDDRWPSMRALLDAIGRDPIARRRKLLLGFGLAGAAVALIGGLSWKAATELRHNARQLYWNGLTEQLLDIERDRGLQQANDDALRARDATRMSVYRRYRPSGGGVDHEDPTIAAALLREVEGAARETSEWVSAANETLGRPISYAVLEGHRDGMSSLVFSADGAWLYSASIDGEVWRWNVVSGNGEAIVVHPKQVTKLAISPDGQLLASSSHDGTVRLWSASSRESRVVLEHEQAVMDVAIDPTGRWLASASKDGTAQLLDLRSDSIVTLEGHEGPVYGVSFDAEGARVLTTSADHSAKLWRVSGAKPIASLLGHGAAVFHGRVLPDDRVVTAADDGTVRLHTLADGSSRILAHHASAITSFDVHENKLVSAATDGSMIVSALVGDPAPVMLPPHTDMTWSVRFTRDGQQVASASFDGTARLTRADGRGVPQVFVGHRLSLFCAVLEGSGRWLATGAYDTRVRLWDLDQIRLEVPLVGHTGKVIGVELDATGVRAATVSHDSSVRIWDSRDGTLLETLGGDNKDVVNHAAFSPSGDIVGVGRIGNTAELWQLSTHERRVLGGHTDDVWRVAFDHTGEHFATASFDGTARIWSVIDGSERAVLRGHTDKVTGVDFSPDGQRIVTASYDGTLRVWDPDSGASVATLRGHTGKVYALLRSPDGHTLASASDDGTARLWPGTESAHSVLLAGHTKPVWSLAFDDTGERVVTGSFDGQAMVWSVADGTLLHSLVGHADAVWDAEFGPGDRVITVSNDKTVRVWSLASNDPPIVLSGHDAGLTSLAVTPDGERIITASSDGTAKLWRLDRLLGDPDELLERLGRATLYCLSLDERMRELGEDQAQAQAGRLACERAHGR
jgi:WD40 repeat protein/predicted Ser/Thr protein kinase